MYSKQAGIAVKDIMSFPVITASLKESVKSIAKKMKQHDVDSVVIVDEHAMPIGIVTEGDIVRRLLSRKRHTLFVKAKHIMSRPVISVAKVTDMEKAAAIMVENKIRRLCVIDEAQKLTGIVTQSDIIKNSSYLIGVLREMVDTGYIKDVETVGA